MIAERPDATPNPRRSFSAAATGTRVANNFMGYPVDRHQRFRECAVGMKKVNRFVTEERFLWW